MILLVGNEISLALAHYPSSFGGVNHPGKVRRNSQLDMIRGDYVGRKFEIVGVSFGLLLGHEMI